MSAWDARLYDDKHSFVWKYGASLLELLAPQSGERIVDLGCGTGHLTEQIAAAGSRVIGIDSSPAMIAEARRNFPQLEFEVGDARSFAVPEPCDAVFSNAALHWIPEPERVIERIRRALKLGGRFVAEFGGRGNVQSICEALAAAFPLLGCGPFVSPWYFPSIAEYAALLERGGLEVTSAVLFDRPTPLDGEAGLRHWIDMFASAALPPVDPAQWEAFLGDIETRLRPRLYHNGTWFADYRRLRIVAHRPG